MGQQAEINAAKLALEKHAHLFPHLNYEKRMMERSFKQQGVAVDIVRDNWYQETLKRRQELEMDQEQTAKVKHEVVGEEKHKVEAEVIPIENIDTKRTVASRSESDINKKDNKEAIRAEIKEIEKKLLEKNGRRMEKGLELRMASVLTVRRILTRLKSRRVLLLQHHLFLMK